jgi:hypothetical protein
MVSTTVPNDLTTIALERPLGVTQLRVAAGCADVALLRVPVHDRSLSWVVAARKPRVALVTSAFVETAPAAVSGRP